MNAFLICLVGQNQAIEVDLPFSDLGTLGAEVSRAKFINGHMTKPDEDGVCKGVLIATSRIQCVIEAG